MILITLWKYSVINSPKAFGGFQTLLSPPPSPSPPQLPLKFWFPFLFLSAYFPIFQIFCLVLTCSILSKFVQTFPNLPKLAQNCLFPYFFIFVNKKGLSLSQLGFGDFPKPMHWSLLRICLRTHLIAFYFEWSLQPK